MDVFSTVAARASDETLDCYTERITDAYLARNPLPEAEIAELWRVVRNALADVALLLVMPAIMLIGVGKLHHVATQTWLVGALARIAEYPASRLGEPPALALERKSPPKPQRYGSNSPRPPPDAKGPRRSTMRRGARRSSSSATGNGWTPAGETSRSFTIVTTAPNELCGRSITVCR